MDKMTSKGLSRVISESVLTVQRQTSWVQPQSPLYSEGRRLPVL